MKIIFLLLIETSLKKEVNLEFLLLFISTFASDNKLINVGNSVKVTKKEIISPKVIIQPKSITGLISLKINDKNAQTVVNTVYKIGQNIL
tara:strand:+ start:478 stop:747 length:270 start_codon:yes stop_codon:yes gene_type:complete